MRTDFKIAIVFGVIIAISVIGINYVFSTVEITPMDSTIISQGKIIDGLNIVNIDKSKFKQAPRLLGIADYINTTPEELEKEIEGKVVLYDIWTYSCINCVRTLPYITAWDEKYSDDGLLIIGIHSPEFEFEKDTDNVQMAVEKYGISYPVVLDNDKETWKAFENRYWPRKYIADHEGYIRYDHIGEGKYDETEKVIQKLLEERAIQFGFNVAVAEPLLDIEEFQHSNFRTPELYFGYNFAQGRNQLGNSEGFNPGSDVTYTISEDDTRLHYFFMEGTWKNLPGSMKLISDEGKIMLNYNAKEVNIVTENSAQLSIFLDGKEISEEYAGNDVIQNIAHIKEPGLYNIVNSKSASSHVLEIIVNDPGFEIYTFTFG